ncbi:uncharacterized protein LOC118467290 isoform X3 [Anopheles albimanus]|uniref:uncharacterized protein LOC118467290 isoform X3 n=1 Tax=Anopheles albimanus TaxID=7167 RepID=UPI00163F3A29|nr:uncharacterized protein LOC118467290 isoform X3 [Anopheles albimanus]
MDSSVFLVAAVASIILCNPVKNELTLRDYNKLPRIYEYDDFSKCQNLFSNKFVYCVVSIQLHPNNSSMLWRYIDPRAHKLCPGFRCFVQHKTLIQLCHQMNEFVSAP